LYTPGLGGSHGGTQNVKGANLFNESVICRKPKSPVCNVNTNTVEFAKLVTSKELEQSDELRKQPEMNCRKRYFPSKFYPEKLFYRLN